MARIIRRPITHPPSHHRTTRRTPRWRRLISIGMANLLAACVGTMPNYVQVRRLLNCTDRVLIGTRCLGVGADWRPAAALVDSLAEGTDGLHADCMLIAR